MRLLKRSPGGGFELITFNSDDPPPYAILSHTWAEGQEVTHNELVAGTGQEKTGYAKICFCSDRAAADRLEFFWVDTCCIDKSTSDELSTAINSMFRWYQRASKCYVYLSDISVPDEITDAEAFQIAWKEVFRRSRWFTRGWTLQELLAPASVEFFSKQGKRLGSRVSLEQEIHEITKIPIGALRGQSLNDFGVEDRMSWAARRTTTRKEDKVYCLLGIFGVFLSLIYGEGEAHATLRLREEIHKRQQGPCNKNAGNSVALDTPNPQTTARETMEYAGFLRSLSYPEIEYALHNVDDVQDDTCRWLLSHSHYRQWHRGPRSSSLLMIRGKPGSGKSTAMKRAYKLAREEAPTNETIIAFFFNSRGVSMETKLEGFFRSMLHQLLERHGSTNNDTFNEWKRKNSSIRPGWAWTVKELQDMFVNYVVRSTVKITMFVDALDECESPSAARDLMDLLTNIGRCHDSGQSRLKLCVSSRHYPNISVAEPLQITVEESNQDDITQYIKMTLQRLQIDLGHDLSKEITSRSKGMFLWASLVLERIREAFEDGESRTELKAIIYRTPGRLKDVFKELIDSIPIDERERSNLILSWILFTKRPLSLSELDHALAFRTEYPTYLRYQRSDDFVRPEQMRRLLAKYTRGLVENVEIHEWNSSVTKTLPTFRVQFIHESVREYMLSQPDIFTSGLDAKWSNPGFVDDVLARSCFNYIKAVCVESRVINDIVRQLEARRFDPGQLCKDHMKDRPFLEYAIQFGFEHAKVANINGFPPLYLFQPTTNGASDSASWWVSFTLIFKQYWKRGYHDGWYRPDTKHWSEYTTTQLAFACAYQLNSWVNSLIERNHPNLDELDLSKALCVTAISGDEETIASLIVAGANVNYEQPMFGSPLYLALVSGRDDIVAMLLEHNTAARMGSRKYSPLIAAVSYRPVEIVRLLLDHGAEVGECGSQERSRDDIFVSRMHALIAATQRDVQILEVLLAHAEHERVAVEHYKAAYLAIVSKGRGHAEVLKSAVTKLFPEHTTISLSIKSLIGRQFTVEVWEDTQVSDLKILISHLNGPPPDYIKLVNDTQLLRDHQTLRDYKVRRGSTIQMLPIARWATRDISGG